MTNSPSKTALILGSNGSFGSNAKAAFSAAGWEVRSYQRGTSMNEAAQGADVIVNGLNPAYPDWARELPKITAEVIAAAKSSGATVLIPGNVYNFGTQPDLPWNEDSPQMAHTEKGKLRIELEEIYRASGVRTIILRAGDFIDQTQSSNWYDSLLTRNLHKGRFMYLGPHNVPHAWAYLPDLARAAELLASKRAELAPFEVVHFPGYTLSGDEMRVILEEQLARPLKMTGFPWWIIRLASPFWGVGRGILEMRYLWPHPHGLSGEKFAQLCPEFEPAPPQVALCASLKRDIQPNKAMIGANRFA